MIYLKEFNTTEEYNAFVESGQMVRPNVSLVNEPFTTYFNQYIMPPPEGLSIQHIDGNYYKLNEWVSGGFSNDEANGVSLNIDNVSFIIAKTSISGVWSATDSGINIFNGMSMYAAGGEAAKDFSGKENTDAIMEAYRTTNNPKFPQLAMLASEYVFPNGQHGYLPSAGELKLLMENWGTSSTTDKIYQHMEAIGGITKIDYPASSTLMSSVKCWYWQSNYNSLSSINVTTELPAIPLAKPL